MIFSPFDVVVVPFPFTDRAAAKKRPALVLSTEDFNLQGHSVLAMITTRGHAPWPGDCPLEDLPAAGLEVPCLVRPKLFTLDNRLIVRKLGTLAAVDKRKVHEMLRTVFG